MVIDMPATTWDGRKWAIRAAIVGGAWRMFFPEFSWFDQAARNFGGVVGGACGAAVLAAIVCAIHNWPARTK